MAVGSKRKKVWERDQSSWMIVLLVVTEWGALGDSEMTGQLVRLWRSVMRGWEARLDG